MKGYEKIVREIVNLTPRAIVVMIAAAKEGVRKFDRVTFVIVMLLLNPYYGKAPAAGMKEVSRAEWVHAEVVMVQHRHPRHILHHPVLHPRHILHHPHVAVAVLEAVVSSAAVDVQVEDGKKQLSSKGIDHATMCFIFNNISCS